MKMCFYLLIFLQFYTDASDGVNIVQEPKISFVDQSSSVILNCRHDKTDHLTMFWYRQRQDTQDLELLAFSFGKDNAKIEPPFDKADKYIMTRPEVLKGTLQIEKLEAADSALYYCATSLTQCPHAEYGDGTNHAMI
uniref:Ig-like domain-containing protein n=1 Tax=Astyanax mexicanus TaxID=7994 RepID=A0A3B1IMG0_ASTMX